MNPKITSTIFAMLCCISIFSQTFKGKVYDANNKPIPYVNVVMISAQDSSFINGTVTDA